MNIYDLIGKFGGLRDDAAATEEEAPEADPGKASKMAWSKSAETNMGEHAKAHMDAAQCHTDAAECYGDESAVAKSAHETAATMHKDAAEKMKKDFGDSPLWGAKE